MNGKPVATVCELSVQLKPPAPRCVYGAYVHHRRRWHQVLHTFQALNDQCTESADTHYYHHHCHHHYIIAFSGPQGTSAGGKGRQNWEDS